ncbi:MAG: A/G-specific adenine glycosylase [Cyclobacteriaceae bacterium]
MTSSLMNWYSREKRDLPWRATRNPYTVWLSEIILQQTRVAQGTPYYEKFINAYPTVHALAAASEQEILKLWEGLGYYSRARNLHKAAQQVTQEYGGIFPDSYLELLKLKGIGPYTAAAIASICFHEKVPVVDGNVFRLISRLFGIQEDIGKGSTRKIFEQTIAHIMPSSSPGDFNQAMMEFGALVCTPRPQCENCDLQFECQSFREKTQHLLPVKAKKIKIQARKLHYWIFTYEHKICLNKRINGDIWEGLWDFYSTPTDLFSVASIDRDHNEKASYGPISHKLTHQNIKAWFTQIEVSSALQLTEIAKKLNLTVFNLDELVTLPKPKLIVNYLAQVKF